MGSEVETLAQFAAQAKWEDVPEAVQRHAKLVMLDTIGVMLAGAHRPDVRKLQAALAASGEQASGSTVLSPGWPRADARTAALLNGIAGRSIELCEGHRLASSQAAAQILPGVLAVGEQVNASGRDTLAAFVIGYDVAARFCLALTARPLAHQNGQATMLGAAAAGARLRGFDAKRLSLAMRITTTLLLTPSYTNAVAGATVLNVAGGMSGFAAALAPELALAGFIAQEDAIEEALGKLVGDGFRPEAVLEELGSRWEITRNYFRLYACCNPIHPALDAVQAVLAELKPRPEEIEHIDIATYRFASVMRNPDPPNYFASKYSLPHAAAAMAVRGHAGYAALDDSAVDDPAIVGLRHRVHVSEDPAMSALAPIKRPARVTITLKDGRSGSHALESHRGDFNQPFAEEELRQKFRQLAGETLTPQGIAAVERAVDQADDWASAGALFDIMRRHGR
jgi:2-methylcitrate dehydratase PrpD